MDITTFIEETLMGIKNALERSNKRSKGTYFRMMMDDRVDFDVALTVSNKKGKSGGAELGVASIIAGGAKMSSEKQDEKISKVKFSVKIGFNEFGGV